MDHDWPLAGSGQRGTGWLNQPGINEKGFVFSFLFLDRTEFTFIWEKSEVDVQMLSLKGSKAEWNRAL